MAAAKTPASKSASKQAEKKDCTAIVHGASFLNVRRHPSTNAEVLEVVREGAVLSVDSTKNGWAYVQTKSGVVGYVKTDYIKED